MLEYDGGRRDRLGADGMMRTVSLAADRRSS